MGVDGPCVVRVPGVTVHLLRRWWFLQDYFSFPFLECLALPDKYS